jgi:hypothetical protein
MNSKIRLGVFETNSSSTHTLTIVTLEDFEKWKNGELEFHSYDEKFVPVTQKRSGFSPSEYMEYIKYHTTSLENGYVYQGKFYGTLDQIYDAVEIDDERMTGYFEETGERNYELQTYPEWKRCDLETFEEKFTTPGGETVVAFGKWGYEY